MAKGNIAADLASTEWHRLLDGPMIPIMFLIAVAAVTIIATVASIQWRLVCVAAAKAATKPRRIEKVRPVGDIDMRNVVHSVSRLLTEVSP